VGDRRRPGEVAASAGHVEVALSLSKWPLTPVIAGLGRGRPRVLAIHFGRSVRPPCPRPSTGCGCVHRWCCNLRVDAPTYASPGRRGWRLDTVAAGVAVNTVRFVMARLVASAT